MLTRVSLLASLLFFFVPFAAAQDDLGAEIKKLGAKQVAEDAFKSSFSPDGKKLAIGRFPVNSGLSIVDLVGGKATEITKGSCTMAAWSPDGKQFAFDLRELKKYRVLVMDAAKLPGIQEK